MKMALALTNLSWRFWSRKHHHHRHHHEDPKISKRVSLNSKSDNSSMFDSDALRFPSVKNYMASSSSSSRKMRRKWHNYNNGREMIDEEYDVVVVASDGEGCVSGCESDGCDWSIGWLEPHGGGFSSDNNESDDNSFAVIVPCYEGGGLVSKVKDTNGNILKDAAYFPFDYYHPHNHGKRP